MLSSPKSWILNIWDTCSKWSNRGRPAWTHKGPPRARWTRFFWKMFRMIWNGEKTGFWKKPARAHPGPTGPGFLKNVQNDLKWRENWFLEKPTRAHPGPTGPGFWKMFRMIWNGEKIGFWKWLRLDLPGPAPGPLWKWQNFGVKLQTAHKYCGFYGTRTLIKGRALCESTRTI